MRILVHSHSEVENMMVQVAPSKVDWSKTLSWSNFRDFKIHIIPERVESFPGRRDWSDAVIEFETDPAIYEKIPELDFPGETYYGVIPIERIGKHAWRCKVDNVEQKVP